MTQQRAPWPENIEAIFFDLDGTLADTAPDMVGALQELQQQYDRAPIDYAAGRRNVSNGALGLLRAGFADLEEAERELLVPEYLSLYSPRVARDTVVFDELQPMLGAFDEAGILWGVVTNKPAWLTDPLMQALGIADRSAATVSGDTLTLRKPHPEPLLHACELASVNATKCIYVGDALRDIQAGRAAGMKTLAAGYGYIVENDSPEQWQADNLAASPSELAQMLCKAVNLSMS